MKYDFGFRKLDGSVDQLSKGIFKGDKTVARVFFKLPEVVLERKCEVMSLNVFTITCTLRRESIDSDQPSVLNKPKLKKLISK